MQIIRHVTHTLHSFSLGRVRLGSFLFFVAVINDPVRSDLGAPCLE